MTDNRQDIVDRTEHAQNAMIAGRAQASGFHVTESRAAYEQAKAEIDAILIDLNTLSPDSGGALTLAPYPFEFPIAHQGDAFSYQFAAVGGTAPYTFMRLSGTIPIGLTLTSDGLLSGTVGMFPPGTTFTLGLLDSAGGLVSGAVWMHVLA